MSASERTLQKMSMMQSQTKGCTKNGFQKAQSSPGNEAAQWDGT